MEPQLETKTEKLDGHEPEGIIFLGGDRHNKRIIDDGSNEVHDAEDIYKRVKVNLKGEGTVLGKDFYVYFGKAWQQAIVLLAFVFILTGCSAVEKLVEKNDSQINKQTLPAPIIEPDAVTREDFERGVASLKAESQNSNNAAQQSFLGIGANIGQLAQKMEASLVKVGSVEASLVKANAEVNTKLQAVADLNVKIHASLQQTIATELKAQAEVHAQAVANLKAEFKAELKAIAQAQAAAAVQAGVNNRSESSQQTTNAGRDTTSTEYTKEMRDTILGIVGALGAVIALQLELSRRRAEGRYQELFHHVKGTKPCEPGFVRRALRSLL